MNKIIVSWYILGTNICQMARMLQFGSQKCQKVDYWVDFRVIPRCGFSQKLPKVYFFGTFDVFEQFLAKTILVY